MARRQKNPAELLILAANPAKRRARKNPAELLVLGANPGGDREAAAGSMYEKFHGEQPQFTDDYQEPTPRPETLTELGDLLELRVKRDAGWKEGVLDLQGCGVKLACDAAGKQLYCIGGDQRISRGMLTRLGVQNCKKIIDLGAGTYVAYRTRKSLVGGKLASYEHFLGEETGMRPRLVYDRRGPEPRILFSGGEYRVEEPGIIN